MRKYLYKVTMERGEDGTWCVECADMPGCSTFGDTPQQALEMAADALATCVAAYVADGHEPPAATDYPVPTGVLSAWVSFEADETYLLEECVSAIEA